MGLLDRELRQVRAQVIPNVRRDTLQNEVLRQVRHGSKVYTDEAIGYDNLRSRFVHDVVNHSERYVNGQVHTNGIENFWSLLKRTLKGHMLPSSLFTSTATSTNRYSGSTIAPRKTTR